MKARNVAATTIGAVLALLGLLWFLQGADLVHVQPILCVADCEPPTSGSTGWMIAGAVAIVAGTLLIWATARPARR
jgi:hypothetical protein